MRSMRQRLGFALVLAFALVHVGGGRVASPRRSLSPAAALLQRRVEGLRALVAAASTGPLVPADELLVVVDQRLVRGLLVAALPIERTLGGRYRIALQKAEASFEDGFALVRLTGRASLLGDPRTFVDLTLFGALTVEGLVGETGQLRAHVEVVAVDVQRVGVLGVVAPVERLIADLSHEKLQSFEGLLSRVEIPVHLEREIDLPGLGPQGGVLIPAASLPLEARVARVVAYRGRLWVSVHVGPGA